MNAGVLVVALIGALTGISGGVLAWSTSRGANRIQDAAQKVDANAVEFDIMKGTVATLREEVTRLARLLRSCRRNERALRAFIRKVHPDADLPELEEGPASDE